MRNKPYTNRIEKITALVQDADASGLTRKEWCRKHGITTKTFYAWRKAVKEHLDAEQNASLPVEGTSETLIESPQFYDITPLELTQRPATTDFAADAVIQYGAASILVNNNTSIETIRRLLSAFRDD